MEVGDKVVINRGSDAAKLVGTQWIDTYDLVYVGSTMDKRVYEVINVNPCLIKDAKDDTVVMVSPEALSYYQRFQRGDFVVCEGQYHRVAEVIDKDEYRITQFDGAFCGNSGFRVRDYKLKEVR